MTLHSERLTELLHQYREMNGYSQTSKWYLGLSNAIRFLKRAEKAENPVDRFRESWSSVNNLFAQYGGPGDDEYRMLNRWVTSLSELTEVRRIFMDSATGVDFTDFLNKVRVVRKSLLRSQGEQSLDAWKPRATSAVKGCTKWGEDGHRKFSFLPCQKSLFLLLILILKNGRPLNLSSSIFFWPNQRLERGYSLKKKRKVERF